MKKIVILFVLFLVSISLKAQNFQVISNGKLNIATFELYKPLEHGSLYYFTDFKINKNGYNEAYSEISKYWNISDIGALTAQINTGLSLSDSLGFHIYPVYLAGVSKAFKIGKTFDISIDILYRRLRDC